MVERSKATKKERELFFKIASEHIYGIKERGDLEQRFRDSDDFLDVAVWTIEATIEAAYRTGLEAGRKERK